MKKSLSLVIITMLFVVLGCSLMGNKEETPPPPPKTDGTTTTTDKPADKPATDTSSSSSGNLSYDNFQKIEMGMNYDKVKEIMGSEGNETSSTKTGSYESKAYEWKGDKFARISVRFRNGELVSKSQSNLTDRKGTAELTQDKFNKVNTGMTYEEVKGILGSDGEMTTISKIADSTLTSYTWKGPKFERVFTSYRDDKLTNKTQSGLK